MDGLRGLTHAVIPALIRALTAICAAGAGGMMAAVFAIIFLNALGRYTLGTSLPWGEEMPIYLTIYGVMFGVVLGYLQGRHIRFTIVTDLFRETTRRRLEHLVDLGVLVLGGFFTVSGVMFVLKRGGLQASGLIGTARDLAEATGLPWLESLGHLAFWQSAMPLGGALLTLAALVRLAAALLALSSTATHGKA